MKQEFLTHCRYLYDFLQHRVPCLRRQRLLQYICQHSCLLCIAYTRAHLGTNSPSLDILFHSLYILQCNDTILFIFC